VYAYPSEFYKLWSRERPELDFGPGTFGENLTIEGLLDGDVSVGDRFRVGTAELVVTQPRLPCFKLGIRMGRDEFVTEFLERGPVARSREHTHGISRDGARSCLRVRPHHPVGHSSAPTAVRSRKPREPGAGP
jgi:MOSC domain